MKITSVLFLTLFVLGCGGYGSNTGMGGGAAPHIDALVPNSATAGSPAFTLTVNGSGFTSSSVVYWSAATRPTMFATAKQVTAQISAADVATAGTVSVYVRTSGGARSLPMWKRLASTSS